MKPTKHLKRRIVRLLNKENNLTNMGKNSRAIQTRREIVQCEIQLAHMRSC